MLMETAMYIPLLLLLTMGTFEFARITYIYYNLKKTLYTIARYVGTQRGVNFCADDDPILAGAINFALTGNTETSSPSIIPDLSAGMIQIRIQRYDPTGSAPFSDCPCSSTGCDISAGGRPPDFVVVSIHEGYRVQLRIPLLQMDPIPLRPEIRLPVGGG
jgi:hypothetical protein